MTTVATTIQDFAWNRYPVMNEQIFQKSDTVLRLPIFEIRLSYLMVRDMAFLFVGQEESVRPSPLKQLAKPIIRLCAGVSWKLLSYDQ
jgi:hypothetical protein